MTESIVLNQTVLNQTPAPECKELVTDGIYTVCAETGEVIEYDEERFFVRDTEGIDKVSKSDKVHSHYQRHYTLLPNAGIGTIPAKFDRELKYYAFALRLSNLIPNSAQKAVFMRVAQKISGNKEIIKDKLYIIGAFAIRYCSVDFEHVAQLIPNFMSNFSRQDERTVRQKLSDAIANLNYILTKYDLSKAEIQMRKQLIQRFAYELLSRYGYLSKIDKFSKLYNFGIIKIAVILLLLRDNRREEAIQLYKSDPYHNIGFKHFVVEYELYGHRYVKRLTRKRLEALLFRYSCLYNFKITF